MAAPHHGRTIPASGGEGPPPGAQEVRLLKVYRRCSKRHARVLEAMISRLEIQLNEELSKNSDGSSCCDMMDKIEKIRAKRDAIDLR